MASSKWSSVANGVASDVLSHTLLVLLILSGTAAAAGNADAGATENVNAGKSGHVLTCAGTATKGVVGATGGAAAGVVATSAVGTAGLNLLGFTAAGPAAGSYAAVWMSSTAVANGGAVAAGSLYSTVQATAMGGGLLLAAPTVLTVVQLRVRLRESEPSFI